MLTNAIDFYRCLALKDSCVLPTSLAVKNSFIICMINDLTFSLCLDFHHSCSNEPIIPA